MQQQSALPPVSAVQLTRRGPGAGSAQTCGRSCCPGEHWRWLGQGPAQGRKAAERLPSFIATQTHLCPHHRHIKRHLSPLCISVSFGDSQGFTAWFGWLFGKAGSFGLKNWLLSSSPWFHAHMYHSWDQACWEFTWIKLLPSPSRSLKDLQEAQGGGGWERPAICRALSACFTH